MSRTWKCFGFATLVLALLLCGRGTAQEQDKPAPISPKLEEDVQKLVKAMDKLMDQLNKDFKRIDVRLETLESGPLKDTLKIPGLESEISKLGKAVNDLNSRLDNLQNSYQQLADKVRVARYPTDPRPNGTGGTVRLVNRSGVNATVAVDGRGYVLGPYETRLLENRPLGTFTYEVLADSYGVIQAPVTRTLTADEVFIIQINPR